MTIRILLEILFKKNIHRNKFKYDDQKQYPTPPILENFQKPSLNNSPVFPVTKTYKTGTKQKRCKALNLLSLSSWSSRAGNHHWPRKLPMSGHVTPSFVPQHSHCLCIPWARTDDLLLSYTLIGVTFEPSGVLRKKTFFHRA